MPDVTKLAAPLDVGGVRIRNRVFLAPMSGITDEPFRQRAHAHGAGLVVSEMVASGELAKGRAGFDLRIRHSGLPVHMVQLAGREAAHMAEGARIAAGEGADIIDINMGCPAKKVTGGYAGSALMLRSRPCAVADRRRGRRGRGAGDGQDAARLGRRRTQRADAGAPRRTGRRQDGDGARPHALPVLSGQGRLARHRPRQGRRVHPGRRQWRCLLAGGGGRYPRPIRRRCGDDRPRALWRAVDRRQHRGGGSGRGGAQRAAQSDRHWPTISSPTTRTCWRSMASKAACARRASILAGISTVMPAASPTTGARRSSPSFEPACVIAVLRDVFSSDAEAVNLRSAA